MCEKNLFADLEDEAEWSAKPAERAPTSEFSQDIGDVAIPGFVENCPKCGGSGSWRPGYPCFKCKGKGKLQFKTSPEARGKARKSSRARKQRDADATEKAFLMWLDEHEAIRHWIVPACQAGNSWAQSMYQGGVKYGALTDNMETAIYKAIVRDEESVEGFTAWCEDHEGVLDWLIAESDAGNEFAASLLTKGRQYGHLTPGQLGAVQKSLDNDQGAGKSESDIDLSDLMKGYYAVPQGDTRLKLCVRKPGKNSRYLGWTFVDDGAGYGRRTTYGKQAPDGMYRGNVQDELRAILKDPLEAMVAYGKLTGTCGKCGRLLEDEESVAAGIGPICASKM